MRLSRSGLICGVIVALLAGFTLYLRIKLPYEQIFTGEWVKFAGVDAYYHMRVVDNLVRHFPFIIRFDPYMIYPGGAPVSGVQFFDWLLAGIIWLVGRGSPSQQMVDVIGAYYPAVLGALVVIPVYFAGKELFGRWAGLLAAAVIVVLPGEFLGRSVLGFTDNHVAEVLFTTVALLFLILAIRTARQNQLTLELIKNGDRKAVRPLVHGVLAGVWLATYFLTWQGALLFAFLITIFVPLQFTIDHMRRRNTDYLVVVGVCFLTNAVIVIPLFWTEKMQSVALFITVVVVPLLMATSRLMTRRGIPAGYYPLVLLGMGLAGTAVVYIAAPWLLRSMLEQFSIFVPSSVAQTTMEAQPLLLPDGRFSFNVAWGNFGVTIFASILALAILVYLMMRHGEADRTLAVVWSLVILLASLGQRRFAYYLAVNVALLTGYVCWLLIKLANFGAKQALPAEPPPVARRKRPHQQKKHPSGLPRAVRYVNLSLAGLAIFFLIFFVNFRPTILTARQARFAPSDAWMSSLTWLSKNTPEPAGDPNFYYARYQRPTGEYEYPGSAYGIMSWWDYGYWITRIARRLPTTNPSQDPGPIVNVASFMLSQYEGLGAGMIQKADAVYIVLDNTITTTKLWAIARWAGMDQSQFYDVFYRAQETRLVPVAYFYPTYYRTMAVRLYNFDGKAVAPANTTVISFEERVSVEKVPYKHITATENFSNWQDAVGYIARQKTPNHRIVSNDPFVSPVPLEALQEYRLVRADGGVRLGATSPVIAELKVFQYVGERRIKPVSSRK